MNQFHTFEMSGAHHDYQMHISIPNQEPPKAGFPIIYILDGDAYFQMFHEICKLQARRPEKTGLEPVVLAGIGYKGSEIFNPYRVYDFTPPARMVSLPDKPDGRPWEEHGGAAIFLDFLQEEIKPAIEHLTFIDKDSETLFGHSLGGLFVLYCLFSRSNLFANYFACSPSIWWNEQAILQHEKSFSLQHPKKLFIAAEKNEKLGMYDNALGMYNRLTLDYNLLDTSFFSPHAENHMSIVPAVFSKALRFFNENK